MRTTFDRRRFLKTGAIASAGTLAAPAIVQAQETINWTLATSWPKNAPGVGVNAQRLVDMIEAMSAGRMTVKLSAAGEIVPPFEVFDAVSSNTVQMGHATPYYWQGKNSVFHFFTGVPFGLTATEHAAWLRFGGGQALWEKAYEPFNVRPFYAGSSGPQAGGWFAKEINTLDDLKGVKMRIAGLGGEAMRRLGVNTVLLPPGEIQPALQAGTIDAAEWIGPWNDLAFGLYQVVKYYYMPAFHEFGPALELIVNKESFDGLPDDLQTIVRNAAMASSWESLADFTYHNIISLPEVLAKEGVELRTFNDEIVLALAEASSTVLSEIGSASPLAEEVYQSFIAFRDKAAEYATVTDAEVSRMRQLAFG